MIIEDMVEIQPCTAKWLLVSLEVHRFMLQPEMKRHDDVVRMSIMTKIYDDDGDDELPLEE